MPLGAYLQGARRDIYLLAPKGEKETKGIQVHLPEYATQTSFTYAQCHRRHTGIPDDPRVRGTPWCPATTTPSSIEESRPAIMG